jgi:uncharacterized protein (DUF1501 family)
MVLSQSNGLLFIPKTSIAKASNLLSTRRASSGTFIAIVSDRRWAMKKLLATLMCLVLLSFAALPAGAQTRNRRRSHASAQQQRQYDYARDRYDYENRDNRSFWEKHRDKITTAGGVLGGAVLGSLIGGKKGAAIGAITGGGGAAIYTYKIRNKNRRY